MGVDKRRKEELDFPVPPQEITLLSTNFNPSPLHDTPPPPLVRVRRSIQQREKITRVSESTMEESETTRINHISSTEVIENDK